MMHRLFGKTHAVTVDAATLAILIKPRHDFVDEHYKAIIAYLNTQQSNVLSDLDKDDKAISHRTNACVNEILIIVREYEDNVLKKSDSNHVNKYSDKIINAVKDITTLTFPSGLSRADRLRYKLTCLKSLIEDASISAKESVTLAAIESLRHGTRSGMNGLSR